MPHREDVQTTRFQDSPDLIGKALKLRRRQGHAEQHVRVATIERGVVKWKRLPDVVTKWRNPIPQGRSFRLRADGRNPLLRVIQGRDLKALAGEEQRVPALSSAEFQQIGLTLPFEQLCGLQRRIGKYPPAEPGALVCEPLKAADRGR